MNKFTFFLVLCFVLVSWMTKSQTYNYFGHTIVCHNSIYYYLLPSDSLVVDTITITIRFNSEANESQINSLIDIIDLTSIGPSTGQYKVYRLPYNLTYPGILSLLDTCSIVDLMVYSLYIPYSKSPNDHFYTNDPNDEMWFFRVMELEDTWELTTGNPDVKIAIIDTGIDTDHEDLAEGNDGYTNVDFEDSWNFVDNNDNIEDEMGHGTMLAGLAAAKMNNNTTGIASIAGGWNDRGVTLYILKVGKDEPYVSSAYAFLGIQAAIGLGVDIINCSWGGIGWHDDSIDGILNDAEEAGILVFACSGNDDFYQIDWPASKESVIGVGGTQLDDFSNEVRWSTFGGEGANYGDGLDVSAPACIFSTKMSSPHYGHGCGTSFSSIISSGVAALMLSVNPCLSNNDLKGILYNTADKVENYTYNYNEDWGTTRCDDLGFGRINAFEAVDSAYEIAITNGTISSGNVIWKDPLYYLYDDIEISQGASLRITKDVVVKMTDDYKIIVHPGGALYIDTATITTSSCNDFWHGIEVYGSPHDPSTPQYQGLVVLNSGTISYAICGIYNSKMITNEWDALIPDESYIGGIVVANQASFENNICAVKFFAYPLYDNVSSFNLCSFSVDSDFPYSEEPDYFVKMWRETGITFTGCNFVLQTSQIPETSGGIYSYRSTFLVDQECISGTSPCQGWANSTFRNLHYGIYAISDMPGWYADVRHSVFYGNDKGIYIGGMDDARVTSNYFEMDYSAANECYGLYLDESTGYWVEDNDFVGIQASKGIGVVVNESGEMANEIYNNRFDSIEYAVIAQGQNRYAPPGTVAGLQILCNEFYGDCVYDISVTNAENTGIAPYQGSSYDADDAPAGNQFFNSGDQYTPTHIDNEGEHITYFYHVSSPQNCLEPQWCTWNTVTKTANTYATWSKEVSCPSCIDDEEENQEEMLEKLSLLQFKADSVENQLQLLVDGGNTEDLKLEVDMSTPPESYDIYSDLMDVSPFLSDSVMESAIYKEDVIPNAMLRDVMVANPQSAKQNSLLDKINDRLVPMPEYMKSEILQGKTFIAAKEELESQICYWNRRHTHTFNKLIRYYQNVSQTPEGVVDSIIALYQNENTVNAKYHQVFYNLQKNNTQTAMNLIDTIPDMFTLTTSQQASHQAMEDYITFLRCLRK